MISPLRHAKRRGSFAIIVLFALIFIVAATGVVLYLRYETRDETAKLITHTVERAPFQHIVLEQGEIESSQNVEVVCNVKSRNRDGTAILWVADEGTWVKKGEKLVELDSSALEQEIKQQRIVVNSSHALKISAASALEQAVVAKEEYLDGEFIKQEKTILAEILKLKEELALSEDNARFSTEQAAQGFVTQRTLRADQFNVEKAIVSLDLAENNLKTLRNITKRKELIGFDSKIETAKAKNEAEIKSHQEELDKLTEIEEQLELCIIYAPDDGQVVHANRYSSRGGSAEFVVEPGALVRERQEIIRLPDPANMQVKDKINESKIALVAEGMPVKVQMGAFEDNVLDGVVRKVNKYAEPGNWFSSVKEYATIIEIIDPPENIRTGMTAEVQIFVQELDDALQIPVQALINYRAHYFCMKLVNGETETMEVKIGPTDDKMVVITEGVAANDVVVMNPKRYEELLNLPDLPEPDEAKTKRPGGPRARGKSPGAPGAGGRKHGPAGDRGKPSGGGPPSGGRSKGPRGEKAQAKTVGQPSASQSQESPSNNAADTPAADTPKTDAPGADTPKTDAPAADTPAADTTTTDTLETGNASKKELAPGGSEAKGDPSRGGASSTGAGA